MNVLNSYSLAEALRTCDKHEGAVIGIACTSMSTAKSLIDSLWNEISSGRMPGWEMGRQVNGHRATIRKMVKSMYSTIEIFAPFSVWDIRGRLYHQVLYEKHLDGNLIKELGWCERLSFDDVEDVGSELLDEFLNSFKIV